MKKTKMNLPNKLTCIRAILIPIFAVFALNPNMLNGISKYFSCAIFIIASITDWFDGKIARKHNLVTNFGKFMDPLADKLLVCSAIICLLSNGVIPAWVVLIIVGREFIISGFRLVASDAGIVIAANYWGKWKTASSMFMIIMFLIDFGGVWHIIAVVLMYIAVILTLISLVTYIIDNIKVITSGGM